MNNAIRVNGIEPEYPGQLAFGDRYLLAGEPTSSVTMRVAGSEEWDPLSPIVVRPAYRPHPRPRLDVDHLFRPRPQFDLDYFLWHAKEDPGQVFVWIVVAIAAVYFGHALLTSAMHLHDSMATY